MVPSRTPADPQGRRQAPKTGPGELQGPPGTTRDHHRRSLAGLRALPPGDHLHGPPGTTRHHQGPPGTTTGGPCPPSEHRRPGTTSRDHPGPPGAPLGPEYPPLSTPPAGAIGLRPAPQAPRGPGDNLDLETFLPGWAPGTRPTAGPRSPTFKHPSAGALGLRPAPQAPRGPGGFLDLETFSQRPRDLGMFGT